MLVSPIWEIAIAFDTAANPPATAPVRTSAPKRRRKAKGKAKAERRELHSLTPQDRTTLVDRFETALESGQIDLSPDTEPVEELCLTRGEYALLLRILSPGSSSRIDEYARRAARDEALYAPGDATAHRAHEPGLRIEQRGNGTGVRVLGWADDE